jgi:hypothetical protein
MPERWWTWEQAVTYVLAHRPCENRQIADGLLACYVMGDTFPVRWWRHGDNARIRVEGLGREWVRDRDVGEHLGEDRLWGRLLREYGSAGEIVLEAAAVRRLCEPAQGPDGRVDEHTRRTGPDGLRLLIEMAARAILPNGRPAGMSKKEARSLMSDYITKGLGRRAPSEKTYQRFGH